MSRGLKTGLLFRKLVSEANRWRKSIPSDGRSFWLNKNQRAFV
ncbi:MAG: hypothetical protein GQF41_2764 [Candidatus Rifleibacterium amylolyticum]|nr:MAG: hypothetical protein GQF41_2764 [Candidatus Rifleibacterium amylolyticum]